MVVVNNLGLAIALCIVTMLGWGSWANTQKLAGKDKWPFPLFYWDYAIGVCLLGLLGMFTLGSFGDAGMSALDNLRQADSAKMTRAFLSGVLFNISNILLVVAIDVAGLSLAITVGVGFALVIGTVQSYILTPKGNVILLTAGVCMVVLAMVLSAVAYNKLPKTPGRGLAKGLTYAVISGCLMGFFYPQLLASVSPGFNSEPIHAGTLTPYTALFLFGLGLLISNLVVNTIFMKQGGLTYGEYFRGSSKLHSLGVLGGSIWMLALTCNVVASGTAGPAISYALGQGATLVAAIWGVVIWKEFRGAPKGTMPLVAMMFAGYALGLSLIGLATLQ